MCYERLFSTLFFMMYCSVILLFHMKLETVMTIRLNNSAIIITLL